MEQYACTICTYIVAILAFLILTEMKRHLNLYYDSQNSLKLQVYFFFLPSLDRDYGMENFMYNWQVLYLFAVWRGHLNCSVGIPMARL